MDIGVLLFVGYEKGGGVHLFLRVTKRVYVDNLHQIRGIKAILLNGLI